MLVEKVESLRGMFQVYIFSRINLWHLADMWMGALDRSDVVSVVRSIKEF